MQAKEAGRTKPTRGESTALLILQKMVAPLKFFFRSGGCLLDAAALMPLPLLFCDNFLY
jgi:hypothetical protein